MTFKYSTKIFFRTITGLLTFIFIMAVLLNSRPIASAQTNCDEAYLRSIGAVVLTCDNVVVSQCSLGRPGSVVPNGEPDENLRHIYNFFIDLGLTAQQAAGITGNAQAESGGDTRASNNGQYLGIFQWDSVNRWGRLLEWARTNNDPATGNPYDPYSLGAQLNFTVYEAEQRGNLEGIREYDNVALAAWYWGRFFEVAIIDGSTSETPLTNVQHLDRRIEYAEQALLNYGSGIPAGAISTTNNCGTATSLPSGDAPELAQQLLDSPNVSTTYRSQLEGIAAGNGPCDGQTMNPELLRLLVAIAQNNTFSITSLNRACSGSFGNSGSTSWHNRGDAVDISGVMNGQSMGPGFGAYDNTGAIQRLVDEIATLLPSNCQLGLPNNTYIEAARPFLESCTNVFLDTDVTTGASGPHIHVGISRNE